MTISSKPSEIGYAGNGVTTVFEIPFPFDTSADLKVTSTSSTGVITILTSGFSIAGGGGSTGTCTFLVAPASGTTITILDDPTVTQDHDYTDNDPFPAASHETALDRLTRISKRLSQKLSRALRADDGDAATNFILPVKAARANQFLTFDINGNPSVSSGTGADSGLRADLGNTTTAGKGNELIAYRRTAAEIAAGVMPVNYFYPPQSSAPRDAQRYGAAEQIRDALDLKAVFGKPRTKPMGYSFVVGNIFDCNGPGLASHDFDAEQEFLATYANQGGATSGQYWVDPVNGNDANSGSLNDPFKTIGGCMSTASGLGVIWLLPGIYTDRFDARASFNKVSGGTAARAVRIKAWAGPGSVIFKMPGQQPGEMVWVQTGGMSVYEATPSGGEIALHVIYNDGQKEVPIQWYSSAANANATTSGWYQDAATKKIYIRHQNINLSLTGNADRFEIIYTSGNEHICYGAKIYLEGVIFRGGGQFTCSFQIDSGVHFRPVLYARYCKWQYLAYHNFSSLGAKTFLQDCISEYSLGGDGYNYTDDLTENQICEAVEIDCIGRFNGVRQYSLFDGDRNKQGSSGHNSAVILRVNGQYYGNYGQSIADTGVGSKTWMVGSICGNPYSDLAPTGIGGYYSLWTEGTCYIDSVRAGGRASTYGLWVETGTTYLYRTELHGTISPVGVNAGQTGIFNPI